MQPWKPQLGSRVGGRGRDLALEGSLPCDQEESGPCQGGGRRMCRRPWCGGGAGSHHESGPTGSKSHGIGILASTPAPGPVVCASPNGPQI